MIWKFPLEKSLLRGNPSCEDPLKRKLVIWGPTREQMPHKRRCVTRRRSLRGRPPRTVILSLIWSQGIDHLLGGREGSRYRSSRDQCSVSTASLTEAHVVHYLVKASDSYSRWVQPRSLRWWGSHWPIFPLTWGIGPPLRAVIYRSGLIIFRSVPPLVNLS
jgi:hypothetical protein